MTRILWHFSRILWSFPRNSSKPGSSEFTTRKFRIQVGKNIHLKNSEKIFMSIKFQNFYGCSRSWNLLSSRANTLKIKSSQRGLVKPGSSGFWNPEVPDFNNYITIWPVTYPFTPHSLSHILPDTSLFGRGDFVAFQGFDQGFQGAKVGSW